LKILSIDTCSNICTVAILEDTKLIKEISLDNGLTHSEKLMPMIKQILDESNLQITDINLLVCDKGPGSFTGIRIGSSTVMAFSDSLGIPSVGVNSLETLAYNVKNDGIICSLIDAKNSNCYCGIYKLENNIYTQTQPLCANTIEDILNGMEKYKEPITFVGTGAINYKDKIEEKINKSNFSNINTLSSYNLGIAGLYSYLNNCSSDVLPLYLRKSQAERMLEEKENANPNM